MGKCERIRGLSCCVMWLWCGAGSAGGVAGGSVTSGGVCGSGADTVKYRAFWVAGGVG